MADGGSAEVVPIEGFGGRRVEERVGVSSLDAAE